MEQLNADTTNTSSRKAIVDGIANSDHSGCCFQEEKLVDWGLLKQAVGLDTMRDVDR